MDPRPLLRRHNIHPKKKLGQNFLVSPAALESIVEAAELGPHDRVLEVGPGLGVLTRELLARAGCVLAVELDRALAAVLREELGASPNLRIAEADILKLDHAREVERLCGAGPYKVVANLPYYLTSHVLRRLLETATKPELLVVLVQREVAERAVASPPGMSLLGLAVQYYGEPRIAAEVPAEAFVPRPEVDSAVLGIRVRRSLPFPDVPAERFFAVAAAGFGQKRKGLVNALSSNLRLDKAVVAATLEAAGVEPLARAEQLELEDWARICRTIPGA